jgi:acetyl-CoA acyltransferase 2
MGDSLWDGLTDAHAGCPMGITAENLGTKYGISRQECDEFAIRSQTTWGQAKAKGIFDLEIAPVEVQSRKGPQVVDTDEHPRPETTVDKIAKLKPVFKKDGVVTAANASGICDGAGTVLLASEEAVKQHNLKPLARLVSYGVTGCDPSIMGIGPVEAIRAALKRAGLTLGDVDRVEINEAFAAQFLACAKELDIDMSKANLHGGAISLGHPLGASGSRIVAHLANEFHQPGNNAKIHVGSACIGGGQGIAVVLERA